MREMVYRNAAQVLQPALCKVRGSVNAAHDDVESGPWVEVWSAKRWAQ